ncbi:MAG: catechol 1,2-dioxygenase [Pseudomonadales bacterium]|nr:catechol 1,2-dioxygenase [Pseudomonadales bacterium]
MSEETTRRIDKVVYDIVLAVRDALQKNDVTFEEYRAAVHFLMDYVNQPDYEVALMCDLWFNQTVCNIEMSHCQGTATSVEGPYFLENVPVISDRIKYRDDDGEALLLRGRVTQTDGRPAAGAELFIWHSDAKGYYSGYESALPIEYLRGKVILGEDGRYEVNTTRPVPYTIPLGGITNRLLEAMGRSPWRPAHVHYKIRKPGFLEHTTQAYFKGGAYLDNDPVEAVLSSLVHELKEENGIKVLEKDFVIDPL